jgi:26S proteasome regulatory subunit N11
MLELAKAYNKAVQEEDKVSKEKLLVQKVGKLDPKKHLEQNVEKLVSNNVVQTLGTMIDTIVF